MKKIAETYAIIEISDLPLIDFTQILETSENTIRRSLDGTQFGIKYDVEPLFIADGSIVPLQTLTRDEALQLMSSDEWSASIFLL